MNNYLKDEHVKLVLKFRDDLDEEGPGAETPWGSPVEAHEGGGTFRMANNCLFVPFVIGDLVEAQLNGESRYQVVRAVDLVAGVMSSVSLPDEFPEGDATSIFDQWKEAGAGPSAGGYGIALTLWDPALSKDAVLTIIQDSIPESWDVIEVIDQDERRDEIDYLMDFDLVERDPNDDAPIDYWAPDDPAWESLGVATPDFLASVQSG